MAGEALTPEAVALLKDPRISLPKYGVLQDQATGQISAYNPFAITERMQWDILSYVGDTPRTPPEPELDRPNGQTKFSVILKSRQTGASTCAELALYPMAMYTPGHFHVTIADKKDRADELHRRTQICHQHWPEELRYPSGQGETRQITFDHKGVMQVIAGGAHAFAVGYSLDSGHFSEIPLINEFAQQWSLTLPTVKNRNECRLIFESTPYPMSEPSSEWYMELCQSADKGEFRFQYNFYPYWDSKLNRHRWFDDWSMSNEEIGLLDKYGPLGLTKENLAFRRVMMDGDPEIRRNPALFAVFYPFNDIECWLVAGRSVISTRAIERQVQHIRAPIETFGPKRMNGEAAGKVYLPFNPNAVYALGCDPMGQGRDHGAWTILEVWDDHWEEAVSFKARMDDLEFAELLVEWATKYNAKVGFESNGVGMGLSAVLRMKNYPNLYYDANYNAGMAKTSDDKFVNALVDALLDCLVVHDAELLKNMRGYRGDKVIEVTQKAALLNPGDPGKNRRARDHWDDVSAMMVAVFVARSMPRRFRQKDPKPEKSSSEMTYDEWNAYANQVKKDEDKSAALLLNRRRHRRL